MFSEKVRMNRRRLGLTQEELAGKSGVSVRTVRDLEAGRIARPQPRTLRRLADTFALHGADRELFFACTVPEPGGAVFRGPSTTRTVSPAPAQSAFPALPEPDDVGNQRPDPPAGPPSEPLHAEKGETHRRPRSARVAAMAGGALVLAIASGVVADYWITPRAPAAASADALMGYVVGTWHGVLAQSDGEHLSIELHVNEGGLTATTTYPEAKCVGLVGITEIGIGALTYRERITSGSCSPDGSITLRPRADGQLDLYYVPASNDYTASALLEPHQKRGTPGA